MRTDLYIRKLTHTSGGAHSSLARFVDLLRRARCANTTVTAAPGVSPSHTSQKVPRTTSHRVAGSELSCELLVPGKLTLRHGGATPEQGKERGWARQVLESGRPHPASTALKVQESGARGRGAAPLDGGVEVRVRHRRRAQRLRRHLEQRQLLGAALARLARRSATVGELAEVCRALQLAQRRHQRVADLFTHTHSRGETLSAAPAAAQPARRGPARTGLRRRVRRCA